MSNYLIKRNPSFTNSGFIQRKNDDNKTYTEFGVDKEVFKKIKNGDTIYVSQKEIGIYAKGYIKHIHRETFNSIEEILNFIKQAKYKDEVWWLDKINKFHENLLQNPNSKATYLEYTISQTLLNRTIPLNTSLIRLNKSQSSVTEILDKELEFINNPTYTSENSVQEEIPMRLKMDIYSFFNKNYSISHWIDIDHFVPKSVGGPGNIIENLVPISLNLNRYKSDSIPKALFEHAINFPEFKKLIKKEWIETNDEFLRKKDFGLANEVCRTINLTIQNKWNFEDIKTFYKEVIRKYNPEYAKIIEEYNLKNQ